MATRQNDIKDYCDSLYTELFSMKSKLGEFVSMIEQKEEKEKTLLNPYKRHMNEIISFIDWKLVIFSKFYPVAWNRFAKDFESTVSVPPVETMESEQTPGGYIGG